MRFEPATSPDQYGHPSHTNLRRLLNSWPSLRMTVWIPLCGKSSSTSSEKFEFPTLSAMKSSDNRPPNISFAAARSVASLQQTSMTPAIKRQSNVSASNWHIDPFTAPLRPTYSVTFHPCCRHDICGFLPRTLWTFRPFVSLYSRQAGIFGFWCHRMELDTLWYSQPVQVAKKWRYTIQASRTVRLSAPVN